MSATQDWGFAISTEGLIRALREAGHEVESKVTGDMEIDGKIVAGDAWDLMVTAWDGTKEGLDEVWGA